jgi:ABC-type nitrate/sulfonate/bicarbonate transport system ATPase subunit
MSGVTISGVGKTFPGHGPRDEPVIALDDVSFRVDDREFCSILGHSGCGKTTLLMLLAGFERPTQGEIIMDGATVGAPTWQRTVVFQEYALFPWLTVRQNIAFGLEMKHVPREACEAIVARHVALVGLQGFEDRYPYQLSGGMKQRVSIARALVVDPSVLLMDEPFAALDAQNRARMQEELGRLLACGDASLCKTIVLVTHSIEEAILLSDRVIVLTRRPGRVKADLTIDLPRPRRENDPRFAELKQRIRELIHDEFEPER